jgi:hypothetical protein
MTISKNPALGERAAMSGYLPQFDSFAFFVYKNLLNNQLEWIKVADPEAEKLDDIQYSTNSEIHAYQVKWTLSDATISYLKFCELLPEISSSWKKLKIDNPAKRVIPHLLTNKALSSHDAISFNDHTIGSFKSFIHDVWFRIKTKNSFDNKWALAYNELKECTVLSDLEFKDFINDFDFQFEFRKKDFSVENATQSREEEDLQKLSRFIIEQVAGKKRSIKFTRLEIINSLGWTDRFKTIFYHDLIIDKETYLPINSTIQLLESNLDEHKSGYLFLVGSPGSGKSSLLSYWFAKRKERIIKYFAFDFQSPSSRFNYYERGESTSLFFDLVLQLKEFGIYNESMLPYKDITFLKNVFFDQLKIASEEYIKSGKKTIIIIDGLDHIPREYSSVKHSFLNELLLPNEIPIGVYIILSSQTYDLKDIRHEIRTLYNENIRNIHIDPLAKNEVFKYIEKANLNILLEIHQKTEIFNKSQGHPLYLSYLIEKIKDSKDLNLTIDSFIPIDGEIDTYYNRVWEPIKREEELIELLGLLARINGTVNPQFVLEWKYNSSILLKFREEARYLFNQLPTEWTFFHNSFRQFLLYKTCLNNLTDNYDKGIDNEFHLKLSNFYKNSKIEPYWKQIFHLFKAEKFDEFLEVATPLNFSAQLLEYRPIREIIQDAKLGIEISKRKKDVYSLVRYLFVLTEFEKRLFNINPASFTEELLDFGKISLAKNYLRSENTLYCSGAYALKASRFFLKAGEKTEANILFNLAYPDVIIERGIEITSTHRYEEIRDALEEWVYTAPNFHELDSILEILNHIHFTGDIHTYPHEENEIDLRSNLLTQLGYSLIETDRWDDLKKILQIFDINQKRERNSIFILIESTIEKCLNINDKNRALEFLTLLTSLFSISNTTNIGKISLADLIYKVTGNIDLSYGLIKDLPQPIDGIKDRMNYKDSLDLFIPLIKFNNLLNISGNGVPITSAMPSVEPGLDEELLVEFERMLCLITQIQSEGLSNLQSPTEITRRLFPIVHFYYKNKLNRNIFWYRLSQIKGEYFKFLIYSVSLLGKKSLTKLANYLFDEFSKQPKYWPVDDRRKIFKSLLLNGLEIETIKIQLINLEIENFKDQDIDGRIRGCIDHSELWKLIGDLDNSEKWVKRALQESLGIGYSKDYQFSTWIKWLEEICSVEPENAPERIEWFLARLPHIKETTEGRAYWYASEELLKTTFALNLNTGFEQLKWQLNEALIDFESSMAIFIESYFKVVTNEFEYKGCFQLYCELYLLIGDNISNHLLELILNKGYSLLDQIFLNNYLLNLIDCIKINALEEFHFSLLSTIADFCTSHNIELDHYYENFIIPSKDKKEDSNGSTNNLVLSQDHKTISFEDVLEKVIDFESLYSLIKEEDHVNSYFDWTKVFTKINHTLSALEIRKLSEVRREGSRGSRFYSNLSSLAFKVEDKDLALLLANKSLELSGESGWLKYYDGGTRLEAFQALQSLNHKEAIDQAFEVFSNDIINSSYSYSYAEHLDEILPFISDDFQINLIWQEIFDYLNRLISKQTQIILPEIQLKDYSIENNIIDYLIYLTNNLTFIVKEKSIYLLTLRIIDGDDYAIKSVLNKNIDESAIIDILMLLRELKPEKLSEFKSIALNLATSKNYKKRKKACAILSELNIIAPTPKSIKLSEIYSLIIPHKRKFKVDIDKDKFFPEININDPEELIQPFEFLIDLLSEESGLHRNNLMIRVNQLMMEMGNQSEWTSTYEKELRFYLDEIRLRFSYPRPRVLAAKNAILTVVTELLDSGSLTESFAILKYFQSYDYKVTTFKTVPKPSFIQTLKERDFGGVHSDWIKKVDDCSRFKEKLLNYNIDYKVLGEYTHVKNLDWGSPEEIYMSALDIDPIIDDDSYHIFGSVFHIQTDDYFNLESRSSSIIVLRNHRMDQFGLKSEWIAINPDLARFLEWIPNTKKLFSWKNTEGDCMVESIYWKSGNSNTIPRKDSEVGEGWLVLVSEKALIQIIKVCPILFIKKLVFRSKYNDSILEERRAHRADLYNE